jgi:hypothetical protein
MKFHKSTKEQNQTFGYVYLSLGALFIVFGAALNENILYIASVIMFALGGYRLLWLDKKLKK